MVIRQYGRPAGPTKGENVRYDATERDNIIQELYDFLKESKKLKDVILEETNLPKANKLIDRYEKAMDIEILGDAELYQGIQAIYRRHGVHIPTQHTIDKGECITVKKRLIKEQLNMNEKQKNNIS